MENELQELEQSFNKELQAAQTLKELENTKVSFLGKKGKLPLFMKQLKSLSNEEKAKAK